MEVFMNPEKEYVEFQIKLAKHISDIKEEYKKLSPQVQRRIAEDFTVNLQLRGFELTVDTLMNILRNC